MLRKTRLLLTMGIAFGAIWAGTFAAFTDSGTATSTFTAGTVNLTVGGEVDDAYDFTSLDFSDMKPTDVRYAALTVANAGTLSFSYSMSTAATGTDGFKNKLQLGIRKVAGTCDATTYAAASGANILTAEGNLSAAAIASRTLASGSEVACFKVSFPTAGDDDNYQGSTTTATFTFSATQS